VPEVLHRRQDDHVFMASSHIQQILTSMSSMQEGNQQAYSCCDIAVIIRMVTLKVVVKVKKRNDLNLQQKVSVINVH